MALSFFMPMIPSTATFQSKGIRMVKGKPVIYESARLKASREKLEAHLASHVPAEPYEGALRLMTKWCFPINGKRRDGDYKDTKPDTDNLQKLLKDVMTKLRYWIDDAQISSEIAEKFYAEIPGIYISVEELG